MTTQGAWHWASPQPEGHILDGVVWAESPGKFVAVGRAGTVLTSPSGAAGSWQIHNSGTTAWFQDIVWTGSELLAVGAILTRPDPTADTTPKGPPAPSADSGSSGALDPWTLLLGLVLTARAGRRRQG